ncbi:cyclin-like protein [Basidiobolus meristosporus CBS 931.73]|uniref:Cyclin-like protein n=1 Tax=Basidiobolus meristosporus CBS 931.73 TaxID=1314790 RepID=A0A1Y1ZC91_9FUNG|nr:cyclin-like protein [Basidiobolus meristosporus CBS 931.73]|eukprot:ORY07826.1 cyclin-like protein [Basidiobolus meristosporus CBS 931.73]
MVQENGDNVQIKRQAAFNFLSSINLGKEKNSKPISTENDLELTDFSYSEPNEANVDLSCTEIEPDPPDITGERVSRRIPNEESSGELKKRPTYKRQYTVKDRKAADFLSNISLRASDSASIVSESLPNEKQTSDGVGRSLSTRRHSNAAAVNNGSQGLTIHQTLPDNLEHSNDHHVSTSYRSEAMTMQSPNPAYTVHSGKFSPSQTAIADVQNSRLILTTPSTPFMVFSVLKYYDEKTRQRRRKKFHNISFDKITGMSENLKKKKAESYAHLLVPSYSLDNEANEESDYDPYFLDDPDLKTGTRRTVISLPGFMGSIIQFTKPAELKKEINDHFRQTHPTVDSELTLSKIRSLKNKLVTIAKHQDLEISTVANAYAYFEKLVLKNYVKRDNRRLIAGVCLFLATKANEPKERDYLSLLESVNRVLEVTPKELREQEFAVFTALDFNLYLPRNDFMAHFERIFNQLDYNNVQDYLGENLFFVAD